jgi:hypothetical protein
MRSRLAIVVLLAVSTGLIAASVGASTRDEISDATCALPGTVPCLTDSECAPYSAICDVQSGACVCAAGDLGTVVGSADLSNSDGGGGSGGGGGSTPGNGVGGFLGGGGMTGPPKTASSGCSYAPGSR